MKRGRPAVRKKRAEGELPPRRQCGTYCRTNTPVTEEMQISICLKCPKPECRGHGERGCYDFQEKMRKMEADILEYMQETGVTETEAVRAVKHTAESVYTDEGGKSGTLDWWSTETGIPLAALRARVVMHKKTIDEAVKMGMPEEKKPAEPKKKKTAGKAEEPKPEQKYLDRPPLGLVPKKFWLRGRVNDIRRAITEYMEAEMPVPEGWLSEYNETLEMMRKADDIDLL